jgi:hypothetical protein
MKQRYIGKNGWSATSVTLEKNYGIKLILNITILLMNKLRFIYL